MTNKRSLKVLTGETPTPKAAHTAVRARTLVHLQRMVAATALANCTKPVQSDTTITPKTTSTAPDGGVGAITTPPVTSIPTGYAVVDPMPSPARCYGAAASLAGKAQWKQDATGMYVELTITIAPSSGVASTVTSFDKATNVMGANTISSDVRPTGIVVRARPLAGNTFMSASVGVQCGGGSLPGAVVASLTLPAAKAKVGDVITVTLVDR